MVVVKGLDESGQVGKRVWQKEMGKIALPLLREEGEVGEPPNLFPRLGVG